MTKQSDRDWREQVLLNMAGPATALTPAPTTTITAPTPFSTGFPSPPSLDVIELLPPAAADKLRLLRQHSDDLHAIMPAGEDVRRANMARVEAAAALSRLTNHPQEFGFNLKPDDRRVIEAQRTLDKATADAKRLTELQEVRSATWQTASQAKAAVETWLKSGRPGNTTLEEAVEVEPPKLNKGKSVIDAIERHRRRVRKLRADLHRIESAPFPSNYAKAQMRQQIEALAMQGAPSMSLVVEHDGKIVWQTQQMQSTVYNVQPGAVAIAEVLDTVALIAWLHRDALIKRLDAEIDAEADDKAALSHEARQKAEAEVMGDLLAVERDEAALVWSAMARNLPVEHRADINPVALLGVRLVTAPRANPSPGTSPEHAFDIVGG